jgi:hypothetical protein
MFPEILGQEWYSLDSRAEDIFSRLQNRRNIPRILEQDLHFLEYYSRSDISWDSSAGYVFRGILEQRDVSWDTGAGGTVRFLRHERRSDTYWDNCAGEIFPRKLEQSRNDTSRNTRAEIIFFLLGYLHSGDFYLDTMYNCSEISWDTRAGVILACTLEQESYFSRSNKAVHLTFYIEHPEDRL